MGGHVDALSLLLDRGANLEQTCPDGPCAGFTAFVFANGKNQLEAVKFLIARGAAVNHHTRSGLFPLQFSANTHDLDRVKLLLEANADVNLTNAVEGGTALGAADERGRKDIARHLILSGARLQRSDNGGGNNAAYVHTITGERNLAFVPLVRAFPVSAGSALLDAIMLSDAAANEAEELRAVDVELAEATLELATHVQQLAVVLTSTLSETQLGELLRCEAGAAAFRHAVATRSILFLARPNVQNAASKLWLGNLLSALVARRILDTSWNVRRRVAGMELAGVILLCVPAAILNLMLLIPVALVPGFESCVVAALERVGFNGFLGPQTGRYRAIQAFRWRDFYLLDVACVKLAVRCVALLSIVAATASVQAELQRGAPPPLALLGLFATYVIALVGELQELTADGLTYYTADPLNTAELVAFAMAAVSLGFLCFEGAVAEGVLLFMEGEPAAPPSGLATTSMMMSDAVGPLISSSLGLLTVVQIARVFLISSSLGPLVLMIYRMITDMGKWLQLLSLVVLAFGLTLNSMLRGSGLLTECDDAGGMAGLEEGLLPAVWALFKYAVGAADILELDCLDASPAAMITMVVYSVLTTILLVNMLIAIMAKTFDDIWEQQERNHQMNFAQLALTWHAATVAPPPLSVFRLLAVLLGNAARWVATCGCRQPSAEAPFGRLEESDMAPTATEAWAKAHTEESLLTAVDAFLDRHGDERAREGKWRTALMRRLGSLEVSTREARKEFSQAAEIIKSLQSSWTAPGAEASPSLEPSPGDWES